MNPLPLGVLAVVTPGVAIQFTSNCQSFYSKPFYNTGPTGNTNGPEDLWCERIYIRANPSNAGTVFIGFVGMNKTTGQGVIAILGKTDPPFVLKMGQGSNKFRVGDIYVDASNGGDSIVASAEVWG